MIGGAADSLGETGLLRKSRFLRLAFPSCSIGDEHWGMVGHDGGEGWLLRSRPCVLSCEGYMRGRGGEGGGWWQMLGVFLEAVAPEPDLPMCPLMGHMEGRCCRPVPLCHTSCRNVLKGLQQRFTVINNKNKGGSLANNTL